LLIAGDGVASGYLGNAELTRERFLDLAFDGGALDRYYRSGDVARRTPSGEYEYMGRLDRQIQIKGFRVELGEIEAALLRCPGVTQAVVLASARAAKTSKIIASLPERSNDITHVRQLIRAGSPDERIGPPVVAAYLVCESESNLDAIRQRLADFLPDYMLPDSMFVVTEIPLSQNGKVDAEKLQAYGRASGAMRANYCAPRNPTEVLLVRLFKDLLDVPRVGVHDAFFELGGDSILIIQLRSRALKAGLGLSVEDIYRLQTPAALAASVPGAAPSLARERVTAFALLSESEKGRLPEHVVDAYPLARLQAGLLFHSMYGDGVAMYRDTFAFRLRAVFDANALRAAIDALVRRHAIFRTSFHLGDFERPLQFVHDSAVAQTAVFDYRAMDELTKDAAYEYWLEHEKRLPYDVSRAPLLRFAAHRFTEAEFVLTMSFHDALLDGWSESSTVAELFENYVGMIECGRVPQRDQVETQFSDFVAFESEALADTEVREFWKAELANVRPTLFPKSLRVANVADDGISAPVRFFAVPLPDNLSDELKALAQQLAVSLKIVLLAAHAAVVSFLCGETDITLAVESNGRLEDGDGDEVLGTHLNVVPWRMTLVECPWESLVKTLYEKEAALVPYRRFPYQELQQQNGNAPLFDISFNYTHFHVYEQLESLSGLEIIDAKAYIETHFVMRAEFNQDPFSKALTLDLEVNADWISSERIREIGGYYRRALSSIATSPGTCVTAAVLMSEAEVQTELTVARGKSQPEACTKPFFIERFDHAAQQRSAAIALVDASATTAYGALVCRSRQVAAKLRRIGVGKGDVVAIVANRSADYAIAILALWRLGAVFVPLPAGPKERVLGMLTRADAGVVLVPSSDLVEWGELNASQTFVALENLCVCAPYDVGIVGGDLDGADVAYIIFTSGSTGEPKGVIIDHTGMINHMTAKIDELGLGQTDLVSQDAAATFDIFVWQMFAPLLAGSAVRIYESQISEDPAKLLSCVFADGITILEVSPSVWSSMLAVCDEEPTHALRWLVSSGETLSPALVERTVGLLPNTRLLNMWGATETSDDCTHCEVASQSMGVATKVPIGRPIHNASVYVLDVFGRLVPRGTPGELCVGGACVGQGYVNDPERSAAAFSKAAASFTGEHLIYRSGDRGLRDESGDLYFIGRRDDQVKIRGHRVELGDVEYHLNKLAAVREAVALALPDAINDLALYAWVVPEQLQEAPWKIEGDVLLRGLREELTARVPRAMIPDRIVLLEALPRNVNGKVDRNALAAAVPPLESDESNDSGPPRDHTEAAVLRIFETVLKRSISVDRSFFDCGGNSLLATQCVSRTERTFGLDLGIRSLFEHSSVRAFADFVRELAASGIAKARAPIAPAPRPTRVPLSSNTERLMYLSALDVSGRAYNSHFVLDITGPLDAAALAEALQVVIDRHEILRTTFEVGLLGPEQKIHDRMAFELRRVSFATQTITALEVRRLIAAELDDRFLLDRLPLCGASLYEFAEEQFIFVWRSHHIIGDGWSAGIMLREVEHVYAAVTCGRQTALPAPSIQFADYALWQREFITSQSFVKQMTFWTKYLGEHPAALELPTDFNRPPQITFEGQRVVVALDTKLTAEVLRFCRACGTTVFTFLQCAIALLLSRFSKQVDLLIGTVVANRNRYETEGLIGFMTNTLPIRHTIDQSATFARYVTHVGDDLIGVFENQEVPFAHLVQQFVQERESGSHPLVSVMLILQNEDMSLPKIDGLTIRAIDVDRRASIVDLLFDLAEANGRLAGHVEFNSALFAQSTIEALIASFEQLARSIVNGNDEPMSALRAVSDEQWCQLRDIWLGLHAGRGDLQFWERAAVDSPFWEEYVELADRENLLFAAHMAISTY
jgi:amino acid adenylation domain-containing protein